MKKILVVIGFMLFATAAEAQTQTSHPKCGVVMGKTPADYAHGMAYCEQIIARTFVATGVRVNESLIFIQIPRNMANGLMSGDKLTVEVIGKKLLNSWHNISGIPNGDVYLQYEGINVVTAEETLLSGQKITIK